MNWFLDNAVEVPVIGMNLYPMFTQKKLLRDAGGRFRIRMPYAGADLITRLGRLYHERYGVPLMISETASMGSLRRRLDWLDRSVAATRELREEGVPLVGLYLVADVRPRHLGLSPGPPARRGASGPMGCGTLCPDEADPLRRVRTSAVDSYQHLVRGGVNRSASYRRVISGPCRYRKTKGRSGMFRSFFLAGFEGSTGYNRHGHWFDQVVATGHDRTVDDDYRQLAALGIHAARETIRWPLVDLGHGRYDFSTVEPFVEAAHRHGVEVIWDLFHYGYPQGLDLWSEEFPKRFADYCYASRPLYRRTDRGDLRFHAGQRAVLHGLCRRARRACSHRMRRGAAGISKSRSRGRPSRASMPLGRLPGARIVNVDPLCRVAPPPAGRTWRRRADFNDRLVFQSWDMLCGRLLPELGGSRSISMWWASIITGRTSGNGAPRRCRRGHFTARRGRSAPMAPGDLVRSVWSAMAAR